MRLWVFRVAHNLAFDERHRRKLVQSLDAPAWEGRQELLPDTQPDPEQSLIERERFKRLPAGLSGEQATRSLLAALPQLEEHWQTLGQKIVQVK